MDHKYEINRFQGTNYIHVIPDDMTCERKIVVAQKFNKNMPPVIQRTANLNQNPLFHQIMKDASNKICRIGAKFVETEARWIQKSIQQLGKFGLVERKDQTTLRKERADGNNENIEATERPSSGTLKRLCETEIVDVPADIPYAHCVEEAVWKRAKRMKRMACILQDLESLQNALIIEIIEAENHENRNAVSQPK
jgi:hypothetical protein